MRSWACERCATAMASDEWPDEALCGRCDESDEMTPKGRQLVILADVAKERASQDAKWGEQNHNPLQWLAILTEEVGEVAQEVLRNHFGGLPLKDYRDEMVQVAAVAVAAIESLDRQRG